MKRSLPRNPSLAEALEFILSLPFERAVLSASKDKEPDEEKRLKRALLRPVTVGGQRKIQLETFTRKQAFQKNLEEADLPPVLEDLFGRVFMEGHVWNAEGEYLLKISRKGKVLLRRFEAAQAKEAERSLAEKLAFPKAHDREKEYLLTEGLPIPVLKDLGVITKEGRVAAPYYDKFRQIDRFVRSAAELMPEELSSVNLIDFGCGRAYLTFVLYDYLTRTRGLKVRGLGIDLKKEVIENCRELAEKYGYSGLSFEAGSIENMEKPFETDLVLSLHACDTATDAALFQAVKWGSRYIMSVPCCQHEVFSMLRKNSQGSLTEYGLIREREAALLTDALRADLLAACGYEVDVLEFVEAAHSPKNIMLRAKKRPMRMRKTEEAALLRVKEAMKNWQVKPALYRMLEEGGLIHDPSL